VPVLAVLGATGRIGRHVVTEALSRDQAVRVLIRDPSRLPGWGGRVAGALGDARDPAAVRRSLEGAMAVISSLGPDGNTPRDEEDHVAAVRTLLGAMRELGIPRLITVLGAGVDAPGDRKGALDRLASAAVRRLARHIHGAKRREFELLRGTTGIAWVGARPPFVTTGPGRGGYRVHLHRPPGRRIAAADLALFLVDQVSSDAYLGAAPFVAGPSSRRSDRSATTGR